MADICEGHEAGVYNPDNQFCVTQCGSRYECAHKLQYPEIPTCDLVKELAKREGIQEIVVAPYQKFCAGRSGDIARGIGPVRIFVVVD